MNKKTSKRSSTYEKKLAVDATFDELLAISLGKEVAKKASAKDRTSKSTRKGA